MSARTKDHRGSASRGRLLATARDLFTRHGASNVGINDVTDTAGVARMTLYNNFPSKEALTLAVYKEMVETTLSDLRAIDRTGRSEKERVCDLFDHFDLKTREPGSRGCPYIHASLQAAEPSGPIYALVQSYKRELREHVLGLLDTGRAERAELADVILILLDGAVTEAYLQAVAHPLDSAKRAAAGMLQAKA